MKAVYQHHAQRYRLKSWRRNTGIHGEPDAVNEELNHANTALYGIVNAVVLTLGLAPGLGIIHQGNRQAFVLDIADLYEAEITIPLAFHCTNRPTRAARPCSHCATSFVYFASCLE